jgi:uncharacterized protein YndB with AHSA1/START domain
MPEGSHVVTGEYRELEPARRATMTWVYEGPLAPDGKVPTLVTVELREDGGGTNIDLHHENLTHPNYREVIKSGAWTKAFDELEAMLTDKTG